MSAFLGVLCGVRGVVSLSGTLSIGFVILTVSVFFFGCERERAGEATSAGCGGRSATGAGAVIGFVDDVEIVEAEDIVEVVEVKEVVLSVLGLLTSVSGMDRRGGESWSGKMLRSSSHDSRTMERRFGGRSGVGIMCRTLAELDSFPRSGSRDTVNSMFGSGIV